MPRKFDTVEDELDFIRDTTEAKNEYDIYFNNRALITTFNMTAEHNCFLSIGYKL